MAEAKQTEAPAQTKAAEVNIDELVAAKVAEALAQVKAEPNKIVQKNAPKPYERTEEKVDVVTQRTGAGGKLVTHSFEVSK